MRIRRLDLLAFGHFTNASLDLSAGPGTIQLIYGPNETGKSTTLRALRALLYGIDARSPDNFLHDHNRLRVGAIVERADGTVIDFVRRKGNKNTFLNRTGDPVDEGPLRAALGTVGEDLFTSLFGINHERLVAGGQAMVRAGGSVGESLFSAGFGGVSLRDILDKLEAEAGALFKPLGQNQTINHACRLYKEAREKIAAHSLPSRDYEERTAALADLNRQRDAVTAELQTLRRETNRLERIARALPLLPTRRALTEELTTIGEVPVLPENFSAQRLSALAALETGRAQTAANETFLVELDARTAALSVPAPLLARAGVVTDLYQRLGSHLKAARDLPALYAESRTLERVVTRLRGDLGLGGQDTPRLGREGQRTVQTLANQHGALVEKTTAADRQAQDFSSELTARQTERAALPDVTALRDAVGEVQRHGDIEQTLADRRAALRSAETSAAEALKRLELWRGTLAELVIYAAPTVETVDRYEKNWLAAQNALAQTAARQQETGDQLARCQREIDEMLRAGSVPTEDDLAATRTRRDEQWRTLRRAWDETRAAAYEAEVQLADDLADRLRREAARVAQHARLAAESGYLARTLDDLRKEAAAGETAWQQLQQEWRALWPSIDPHPPREMRSWMQRQERLVTQADALRALREEATALDTQIAQHRAALAAHLPPAADQTTLRVLVAQGQRTVEQADRLDREIEKLARDVHVAAGTKADADAALARWRAEWREAMAGIGRAETDSPQAANDFIAGCAELQGQIDGADRLRFRIKAIRSDAEKFEAEAAAIYTELRPDGAAASGAEGIIGALYADLARAKQDETTLAELTKQRADASAALQRARQAVAEAGRTLAALCQQAGCSDDVAQLEAVERKAGHAAAQRAKLDTVNERLAAESAGVAVENFIAGIEASDADQITVQIAENQRRITEHETQQTRLSTEIGGLDRDLQAMDGNARATEAAEEAQSVLAQLEEHTERFIRLKLAATILRREIEDYRAKNQSPLLTRASNFFRQLTLGAFTSVATDFDEDDRPVLEGVRATGQRVRVESLSDGTRDQLFLSLKLATVERFVADCEPMPFIVDDVLVGFDHEREAAVFRVLRELAAKTQVIVFTHHRHLVDLARQILDGAVQVHDLDACRRAAS